MSVLWSLKINVESIPHGFTSYNSTDVLKIVFREFMDSLKSTPTKVKTAVTISRGLLFQMSCSILSFTLQWLMKKGFGVKQKQAMTTII